jgi:DNA-binding XRE family transcriptional regulator
MLRKIKYKKNMTLGQLAVFLEVSTPTLYSWEKKQTWPLWALKKCEIKVGGEDAVL